MYIVLQGSQRFYTDRIDDNNPCLFSSIIQFDDAEEPLCEDRLNLMFSLFTVLAFAWIHGGTFGRM